MRFGVKGKRKDPKMSNNKKIPAACLEKIATLSQEVDKIREHCKGVIKGNCDYYMTDIHDNVILKWHQNKLGAERIEYLKGLANI